MTLIKTFYFKLKKIQVKETKDKLLTIKMNKIGLAIILFLSILIISSNLKLWHVIVRVMFIWEKIDISIILEYLDI